MALREAFMSAEDERSAAAKRSRKGRKGNGKKAPNRKPQARGSKTASLLKLESPTGLQFGKPCEVTIQHDLSAELGSQKLHVTLRSAAGERLHREVKTIQGKGSIAVRFDIPAANTDIRANPKGFQFAVFVGPDYESSLQHLRTSLIPAK